MNYTDIASIPKMGLHFYDNTMLPNESGSRAGRKRNEQLNDDVLLEIAENYPCTGKTKYLTDIGQGFDKPIPPSTIRSALLSAGLI